MMSVFIIVAGKELEPLTPGLNRAVLTMVWCEFCC